MGLDVTAISKAKRLSVGSNVEVADCTSESCVYVCSGDDVDRTDGKPEGLYEGEQGFNFWAGSYTGYNRWREWLSKFFLGVMPEVIWNDPERFRGRPFVELIDFSDCEGAFGGVIAAKLAKDFQENREQLTGDANDWNRMRYADWQTAFEVASNEGFVVLH
jgi:hypothetical protein